MANTRQIAFFGTIIALSTRACNAQELQEVTPLKEAIRQAIRVDDDADAGKIAFKVLQSEARTGNIDAMLEIAKCFRTGQGVKQDSRLAYLAGLKAAEAGSIEGMYQTAVCLLDGNGIAKNPGLGLEWLAKAGERNHQAALERLTDDAIRKYDRTKKGGSDVLKWSQRGANLGNAKCMGLLGACLQEGIGTETDFDKAFELYFKASKKGDVVASVKLAYCHKCGMGTDVDEEQAFQIWQDAAATDDPLAIYHFAINLDELVVGDTSRSDDWDPLALGNPSGHRSLAEEYQRKVMEQLLKAVELGHAESMAALASKYAYGRGCEKDPERAFELAERSSQSGKANALCILGDCYAEGIGVRANPNKGASLYLRAAKLGLPDAQFKYGQCLASGKGVKINALESQRWLATSAANGNQDAAESIQRLRQRESAQFQAFLDSMISNNIGNQLMSERLDDQNREMRRLDDLRRQNDGY